MGDTKKSWGSDGNRRGWGFVFATTAIGVPVYEHQTGVLNGPYIEGRLKARAFAPIIDPVRALVEPLVARIN